MCVRSNFWGPHSRFSLLAGVLTSGPEGWAGRGGMTHPCRIETRSHGHVLLDVPAHLDRTRERAVALLLLVLAFDLGEVEAELIDRHQVALLTAAGVVAGDQDVGE